MALWWAGSAVCGGLTVLCMVGCAVQIRVVVVVVMVVVVVVVVVHVTYCVQGTCCL